MKNGSNLKKLYNILYSGAEILYLKKKRIPLEERQKLSRSLIDLKSSLVKSDFTEASIASQKISKLILLIQKKISFFRKFFDISFTISIAFFMAFFIRQFWFELYEVPTGSMRPSILEKDRILVSKSTFGLKMPFAPKKFFFSEDSIRRGGMVIFTVAGMDLPDGNTRYFGVFPGKKRFIKRCIGKPGDTLYFYGGYVYGLDKNQQPIKELCDPNILEKNKIKNVRHIPFISFEGKTKIKFNEKNNLEVSLLQMNIPIGKFLLKENSLSGLFFHNSWQKDSPNLLKTPRTSPKSFSDLWGIGNFGIAKLVTNFDKNKTTTYLSIQHSPNLTYPEPILRSVVKNIKIPFIHPNSTFIPLTTNNLERIKSSMTTARFVVRSGRATKYSSFIPKEDFLSDRTSIYLSKNIPNGCYEFIEGTAYQIFFGGVQKVLEKTHPIYNMNDELIIKYFNQGFSFSSLKSCFSGPFRYSFFYKEDLYLLNQPFLNKDNPVLQNFISQEKNRERFSSSVEPYIAFIDHQIPNEQNTKVFNTFIHNFGIKVPEGHIMVLGDNSPMSSDSRDFGFVPIENLLGTPLYRFWPFSRSGKLEQPSYPMLTKENYIIWSIALSFVFSFIYSRSRRKKAIINFIDNL